MRSRDEYIKTILLGTGREGMDKLLNHMEQIGFFKAPASTSHHLNQPGGLAEHSLNVFAQAEKLAKTLGHVDMQSVAIVSILHDLGKCGQFGKEYYQAAPLLKSGKAPAKPYEVNKELLPVEHEVRSIAIAGQFIQLTEDEQFAILYHNGLYGPFKYQIQGHETPLYMILHWADMWASRVIE